MIEIILPMPVSINSAYANSKRGRHPTKAHKEWLDACEATMQDGKHTFIFSGMGVALKYTFYSKWFNNDGSVKKKDVSNYIKLPEDYLSKIIKDFDDKYVCAFDAQKIHSKREEVVIEVKEVNLPSTKYYDDPTGEK